MSTNEEFSTNEGDKLHSFCARILGWADERKGAVDHAIRSIELAADHRAALVLLGDTDLVPIARALHRYILGSDTPFIVCDPQRRNVPASVRSPENRGRGVAAFKAATGGFLCVRSSRLPDDFTRMLGLVRDPNASVLIVVCGSGRYDTHPFLTLPVPIRVPSLRTRTSELPRIVDEYALDATAELSVPSTSFTKADRQWILERAPSTLPEIERATLRLVALRMSTNLSQAATRLGMAPVSLSRWIGRRKLPPVSQ
jgi:hypothetical protein